VLSHLITSFVVQSNMQKSASLQTLLVAPPVVEPSIADERQMWEHLKRSAFYENIKLCVTTGMHLPFDDWLRMLMQVPGSIRIHELVRMFDEEVLSRPEPDGKIPSVAMYVFARLI
jgi:hypothetical protein